VTSILEDRQSRLAQHPLPSPPVARSKLPVLEVLAVIASPAALFWILRLSAMAPVNQPDPSMHSTFIFDPDAFFLRYPSSALSAVAMGDASRVGFLLPGRVFYLLFGAIPGFFVYRYFLALIAIVPVYLLLRRLYGRWAGWVGIVVIMSSPVVVTTWGSDYSSSAAISYMIGGLAVLAMSWEERRSAKLWLLGAVFLFTMAVWSNGVCLFLVGATLVSYLGLRLLRDRPQLGRDILAMGVTVALTTGVLAVCSQWLLGQSDFISLSIKSEHILNSPAQVAVFHSTSWAWAPYDAYLLIPPAVVVSFFLMFTRRARMRSSLLFVGIAGGLQLGVLAYFQFFGRLWVLEMPLFSCLLWSSTNLMLALILCEGAKALTGPPVTGPRSEEGDHRRAVSGSRVRRIAILGTPVLLVLAVPIAYEASPSVPALTWAPWGFVLALVVIAATGIGRLTVNWSNPAGHGLIPRHQWMRATAAGTVVVISAAALILTVAPWVAHPTPPNTSPYNTPTDYSTALGGSAGTAIEEYQVTSEVPAFVGQPAYRNEQLIMWMAKPVSPLLYAPIGLYEAFTNTLSGSFPSLDALDRSEVETRHPGQMLLLSVDGNGFDQAVQSLHPYAPVVVRRSVLGNSSFHLHLWLVDLTRYDVSTGS
jgi:hypothetical protein